MSVKSKLLSNPIDILDTSNQPISNRDPIRCWQGRDAVVKGEFKVRLQLGILGVNQHEVELVIVRYVKLDCVRYKWLQLSWHVQIIDTPLATQIWYRVDCYGQVGIANADFNVPFELSSPWLKDEKLIWLHFWHEQRKGKIELLILSRLPIVIINESLIFFIQSEHVLYLWLYVAGWEMAKKKVRIGQSGENRGNFIKQRRKFDGQLSDEQRLIRKKRLGRTVNREKVNPHKFSNKTQWTELVELGLLCVCVYGDRGWKETKKNVSLAEVQADADGIKAWV